MLVTCPECAREISDRAQACPGCGFPIAEEMAARAAARTADRDQRKHVGEVDCPTCEARGFRNVDAIDDLGKSMQAFEWCVRCLHSGRIALVQSPRGWYAVTEKVLAAFVGGELDEGDDATFLGAKAPAAHRYPAAGERHED
ncbi:MAG TPA: hypothetical protein VG755_05000 [Nannocystaceae bacterium]|nr:hypothetical protein [Nannocystaceae bacterium]